MSEVKESQNRRAAELRARIRDWLGTRNTLGTAEGWREAERLFARRAVRIARDAGARVWADNAAPAEQSALQSLQYLLCETKVFNERGGYFNTGGGRSWVLDAFEAVLDQQSGRELKLVPLPTGGPQSEDEREVGVIAFADEKSTETHRPGSGLGLRILTAYTLRDDDEIVRIAEMLG